MFKCISLALCIVLATVIAWAASKTPTPAGIDAPREAFSAARAWPDVQAIGARPHPIGSAGHDLARDLIVRRLWALGLSPQVWRGRALERFDERGEAYIEGGEIQDIIAVLPGRSRAKPAVAIMAHYDSVPASPGAADDTVGVAAALETARALKASGSHDRDVVLLLTDGEEAGLLGARAFFADNPLARHIGAVLNLESRGGGGRAIMFQTGPGDGAMIDLFARTAAGPTASSLTGFVYAHMPNDTDFTISSALGLPGFNFAFIGRPFDYHAASSTSAVTERGSLQHIGQQALAAARALADAPDLPPRRADVVYQDLLGGPVIVTPAWAGWLALAASGALAVLALRWHGERDLWSARAFAALGGALVLAQILYIGHAVVQGVGVDLPEAIAPLVMIAVLPLFPLLWPSGDARRLLAAGGLAIAIGLGLVLFIRFTAPWSPRHPRPTEAVYVADLDQGRFLRVSPLQGLDGWTTEALGSGVRRIRLSPADPEVYASTAPPVAASRPEVSMTRDDAGRVTIRLAAPSPARQLRLDLKGAGPLVHASVNGAPAALSAKAGQWTHLRWDAAADGLTVAFDAAPGPVEARWGVRTDGWPRDAPALPQRPADAMPWNNSDSMLVVGSARLAR